VSLSLLLAASVTLAWDASPNASSYRLYVGIQSLQAGNPPLVFYPTRATQCQVDGLDYGTRYYFAATAFANGLETVYSNEVSYVATPTPTPALTPIPITVSVDNPSFEQSSADGQVVTGWLEWGQTSASYTESCGGSHSGAKHLTHYRESAYKVYTYQIFVVPLGKYLVECWGMTPTGQQTWTGMVLKDNGVDGAWVDFPKNHTYQKLSATINVGSGILEVGFWTDSLSQSATWTYMDDVSITYVP
jgi:hypothetical protein